MAHETEPLLSPQARSGSDSEPVSEDQSNILNGESSTNAVSDDEQHSKIRLATIFPPLALGVFLMAMDTTVVVSTYASIGSEMEQLENTSWIATAYMLTSTSFQPLYGKLSDIFGRKACLMAAYTIFALGSLLCGLSRTIEELSIARALAGVGGGGITTVGTILLSDLVPLRSRGTWQGFMNLAFATGQALGAPLGGIFADTIGWRWGFLVQVPLILVAIITVSVALRAPSAERAITKEKLKRIDFIGSISLVLALLLLLLSLDRIADASWNDPELIAKLCASFSLLAVFVFVELRVATEPLLPKRVVANPALVPAYLSNFFMTATAMAITFNIPLYLQAVQDMTASHAGLYIIPSTLGGVSGSLVGGFSIQRTGKYYFATVSLFALSFLSVLCIAASTGVVLQSNAIMAIGFASMTFGYGFGVTTLLIAIIANAGEQDQAVATAVSYLFRSCGSVFGVALGSAVVQSSLRQSLRNSLPASDTGEIIRKVRESLSYIRTLDPITQAIVRHSYEEAIHVSWIFVVASAALVVVFSFFIKEKAVAKK